MAPTSDHATNTKRPTRFMQTRCWRDPRLQRSPCPEPRRVHEDEALRRSTCEVHLSGVLPGECALVPVWPHANHQLIADDADCHVSAHHEAKTSHHVDLTDVSSKGKPFSDPLSKWFVKGHVNPPGSRGSTKVIRNSR